VIPPGTASRGWIAAIAELNLGERRFGDRFGDGIIFVICHRLPCLFEGIFLVTEAGIRREMRLFDKNRSTDKDKESNFVNLKKGKIMAGKAGSAESVYKIVEVIGTSTKSWDDAAKNAVETAASTLRDLRIAEIVKLDMKVEDGKVQAYRARVLLSFKYQS
jgi:flavin-binding protein dodecin